MEPVTIGIICVALLLVLFYIGMPIGFGFMAAGFLGFWLVRSFSSAAYLLGSVPYSWGSNYTMVVIPLFVLMGQFAFQSRISQDLYTSAYHWVGNKPGGLALATTIACALFAACTGSSLASAATMGTVAIPEMRRFNYSPSLATGCIAAGGTLGILIPPSVVFIVYGIMTSTSIGALFIAGILPGLMVTICFMIYIYLRSRHNPVLGPRGPVFTLREKVKSLSGIWGMIALFVFIIGGLYFGFFTPTEAGAIGAFVSFVIVFLRGRMTKRDFTTAILDTIKTTTMIFMIVIGAQIFNGFLTLSGIPALMAKTFGSLPVSRYVLLIIILAIYIPLGMLMDGLPMILLTLPTISPIVALLGFDPVWFGVMLCMMCELANITPPMGMNLYIIQGVSTEFAELKDVLRGAAPFCFVLMLCVGLIIVFPQIALFLPNLMGH